MSEKKVLDEMPPGYCLSNVLAVTNIDGATFIIQKAISLIDPGKTAWFLLPFIKYEDL